MRKPELAKIIKDTKTPYLCKASAMANNMSNLLFLFLQLQI